MGSVRYPYCMYPKVIKIEGRDIGEWGDEHPLNNHATSDEEYERLFGN